MPFFSIIIPVFNARPFLRECLDSIQIQQFEEWECICIDDGSTDDSGSILDEYASRDPRFRVFHQINVGVSAARNAALDKVCGKFFLFVDADDAIVLDTLDCFYNVLTETGADGLVCHPEDHFLSFEQYRDTPAGCKILSACEQPAKLLAGPFPSHGYVVSKVYRTSLFGHLRFSETIKICEDTRFWADALCVPAQWTVVEKPYYAYRKHLHSATAKKTFHLYRDCIESYGYVFRVMSTKMKATRSDMSRYAARYRMLHSHMVYNAFREWESKSEQERRQLFETVTDVCAAASPVFPFRLTTRFRLYGWHIGLATPFVIFANFIDRAELSIKYRWRCFLMIVGLGNHANNQ